jgi:hypothetical protein
MHILVAQQKAYHGDSGELGGIPPIYGCELNTAALLVGLGLHSCIFCPQQTSNQQQYVAGLVPFCSLTAPNITFLASTWKYSHQISSSVSNLLFVLHVKRLTKPYAFSCRSTVLLLMPCLGFMS